MTPEKPSPSSSQLAFTSVSPAPTACDGSNQVFPHEVAAEERAERPVNEACKACDRFIRGACVGQPR